MLIAMELQIGGYQGVGSRVTPDHHQLDLLSPSSGEASAVTASPVLAGRTQLRDLAEINCGCWSS